METFAVVVAEVGIPHGKRPDFVGIELLDAQDIRSEMCGEFEGGKVVVARGGDDENAVFVPELAEVGALRVVVRGRTIPCVRRGWNALSA